jgi:TrmH family RNA methyltransferase
LPNSLELDRLAVVLVSTRNPLNIGAAARAMSNFGFRDLRVVNPFDVAFREARSAVGAPDLLANAKEFKTVADAVADCTLVIGTTAVRGRELHHTLHPLAEAAKVVRRHLQKSKRSKVALLFGSEKRGLSNADLSHCHWLLHIPTHDEHVSMNLGQAVAVCLYEIARTSALKTPSVLKESPASAAEIERITEVLHETLVESGHRHRNSGKPAQERLRRFVQRLALSSVDSEALVGMLRQILWKLRSNPW